jgi:hypothetical protein
MDKGFCRHRSAIRGLTRQLAWGGTAIATLALLLNLLVWALYAPAMAAGIPTIICTSPVNASAALDGKSTGHVDIGGRHCPLGLLAASLATPPAALMVPMPAGIQVEPLVVAALPVMAPARFGTWNARAPPQI